MPFLFLFFLVIASLNQLQPAPSCSWIFIWGPGLQYEAAKRCPDQMLASMMIGAWTSQKREGLTLAATRRSADILKCRTFKKKYLFFFTYVFSSSEFFKRLLYPARVCRGLQPRLFVVCRCCSRPPRRLKCFRTISSCFQLRARQADAACNYFPTHPGAALSPFFFPSPPPVLSR